MSAVPVFAPAPLRPMRSSGPVLRVVPAVAPAGPEAARTAVTRGPAPATTQHSAGVVRLTRRGRVAIVGIIASAAVLCGGLVVHAVAPAPSSPTPVVVQPGQTLSQIAHEALPALPVGEAIAQVQLANKLNSLQVNAGQTLQIPGRN